MILPLSTDESSLASEKVICRETEAPQKYLRPPYQSFRQGTFSCEGTQTPLSIFGKLFFKNNLNIQMGTSRCASSRAFRTYIQICRNPLGLAANKFLVCPFLVANPAVNQKGKLVEQKGEREKMEFSKMNYVSYLLVPKTQQNIMTPYFLPQFFCCDLSWCAETSRRTSTVKIMRVET